MAPGTPELRIEGTPYRGEDQNNNGEQASLKDTRDLNDSESSELHELLRDHSIPHSDPQIVSFWSIQRLRAIMTPKRILNQLNCNELTRTNARTIAQQIQNRYMKVYAILTLNQMDDQITALMQEGLDDDCLPLVKADMRTRKSQCRIARRNLEQAPLACFDTWRVAERELFLACQYRFIPVILAFDAESKVMKHVELDNAAVLPFMKIEPIRDGGFGSVTEQEVHPDCHGFQDILQSIIIDNKFAVKKLSYDQTDKEFRNEVNALRRFNGFVHNHLVTLLMTWKHLNHHHFLFPLAGCNLEDFWGKQIPWTVPDTIDVSTVQWISSQILGLTGAINTVHDPSSFPNQDTLNQDKKFGRHGDIKPENILWYRSPHDPRGILVIADLGLSSVNSEKSRSNIPNKGIPFTPGYRPPECDLEGGTISRAYDIWTFGCLLLELVSWALGGESSRVKFEERRMAPYITGSQSNIFFDVKIHDDGPGYVIMVKDSVSKWICSLHRMNTCTQYFHDLLDLIEHGMIVTLSQDQARYSSSRVLRQIETMHNKVMDPNDRYCRESRPEKRNLTKCIPVKANLNVTAKNAIAAIRPQLTVYGGKETRKPKTREQLSPLKLS